MTHVLIADDKEENLYYLEALLAGNGCAVDTARDGAEALAKARQSPPQIIISDLLMPVMDGYTLLRQWKADAQLKHIPFVIYTATYTEPKDEQLALDLGADAFILKPSEPEPFIARVRAVLEAERAGALTPPKQQTGEEKVLLKQYNEVLVNKLEEKTIQLEEANRTLEADIAERKRVEESVVRLAKAVEQSAETIIITDTHGTIIYANPAFEKTSGYTCAEALGQNPRILRSGKHQAPFYRQMWDVLTLGKDWRGHFINRRKDGTLYEEDVCISPIRNVHGEIVNYVAVKRDVTREVQLEAQIRQAQKMEAVGQLAGGVAHDFNNILAVLQMQSDLLKISSGLSAEQLGFADEIGAIVKRATALTRQLLLFCRKGVFEPIDLDLNESINEMTKMLRRSMGEHIQLRCKCDAQGLCIHADAGMINQVLMNLAVNARDAMPNGGLLVIETSVEELDDFAAAQSAQARPGAFVCLSVSDTGCGIEPEVLPKIFEPFFTTKDVGKGTGLGLATVFGIVQQHQGWISVHSEVGNGTTFRVYFPRLKNAALKSSQSALTAPCGGNETILLVEDDLSLRVSVRKCLSQLGYRILEAPSGVEALEVWKQNRDGIDLLLTDLLMPDGMTGRELAQRVVQENPKLKVIYMSGYSPEVLASVFSSQEGLSFLTKPFAASKLAQAVRENLDAKT